MPLCGTSRKTTLFQKTLQEFVAGKTGISDLFKIPQVSETYVCKQVKSLNTHKAKGTDDVGPYFLKLAAEIISPSLMYFPNRSIICGVFPDSWKLARYAPFVRKAKKKLLKIIALYPYYVPCQKYLKDMSTKNSTVI